MFTLHTAGFTSALSGSSWSLATSGNNLNLVFTTAPAIPEPSTYAARCGAFVLGGVGWGRSRCKKVE